jgi:protein-L-isoaspartate(D-aspartate) O-methyltransferase
MVPKFTVLNAKMSFKQTAVLLPKLGIRPVDLFGDGYKGLPTLRLFDSIIVTAGKPFIPQP